MRRHLVTRGSFYERLADHGDELFTDDEFAHLYSARMGRPSIPPSVMIRALLCATNDKTSDAETSRRSRVDADWKAAMGVDDDFEGIAARTFSLMRARMIAADADNELFEATLAKAVQAGVFKGPLTAIIDSSPVHGAGAVHDSYELIRGFLGQVARAANETLSGPTKAAVEPLLAGKADIDWQDPVARKAHLGELVAAVRAVLAEVAGTSDPAVSAAAELLAQVIDQDTEPDDDGNPQIRQGVARDRVVSHSDPEMRHGRKSASRRFDGHKMDVVSDEDSELILGVEVRAANAGDGEGAAPLLEKIRDTLAEIAPADGVEMDTVLADMAYSDGDVRVAVEELGMELVAKVPPMSNGGRFPKTDFYVDVDRGEATCPAGEVTVDARPAKDHKGRAALLFVFDAGACAACPLRPECTAAAAGRTIMVGVHEARMADARAAQLDPKIIAMLRLRAKVERKIDHLQDLGMRKARYRGRRKTKLQALLAATVANFKRLAVLGALDTAPQLAAAA
jgi:transposase